MLGIEIGHKISIYYMYTLSISCSKPSLIECILCPGHRYDAMQFPSCSTVLSGQAQVGTQLRGQAKSSSKFSHVRGHRVPHC